MHDDRQAFIKSESDEKLTRALRHQARTSSEVKYVTGDKYITRDEQMTIRRNQPQ